ncbi:MAG TPA: transcription antitermination factor NusB [Pseudomonadales bacterium]
MSTPSSSETPGAKVSPSARRKARRFALQALYQWQMTGNDLNKIELQFHDDNNMRKTDVEYFHELLHKVPANLEKLDVELEPFLDIKKEELGNVELAALRISTYELCMRIEIPYQIVINEGIELAKTFGAEDSYRFVNGVLDKVAKKIRPLEFGAK